MSSRASIVARPGISEVIPIMLPHPGPFADTALIAGMLCYIVRHYHNIGISCLISRHAGGVRILMGDWNGRTINLADGKDSLSLIAKNFLYNQAKYLLAITKAAGIGQALFYFALDTGTPMLVDIRTSLNKFLGPGMIRDVFGKRFDTQQIIKIDIMSEQLLEQIKNGSGDYGCGVILKPSRSRSIERDGKLIPLYVEIPCSC